MKKKKFLDGRTKTLYEVNDQDHLIMEFQDAYSPYETIRKEKTIIKGKGEINKKVSGLLFDYLSGYHVNTHYIQSVSNREMLVMKLKMIPVEVMVRNIAVGSLVKRFNLREGTELNCPVCEYYIKGKKSKRDMINPSHLISLGYAGAEDVRVIEHLTSKINAVLKSFFYRRGLLIADFKLEFGLYDNDVILGDELSLDTCRLIDEGTHEKLFKDWSRTENSDARTSYKQLHDRIFQ
ncbi:MAG: phosphoribosylaminoimidazolesuccinocarboxamide synthase [candidate division KSB1 bacterium]|nr:phosphoribosylaminoimidazolesuccinocarboxamide synthase [candidate division KSB1 bacterium]